MNDYNDMVRLLNGKKPTAILKYPSGKYGLCGSIPVELTEERNTTWETIRTSKVFNTEADVINALLALGITKFQLCNCSWYK